MTTTPTNTRSQGGAVHIEAVAKVVMRRDGLESELAIEWLSEGGICSLTEGTVLMVADAAVTDDEGAGTVYLAAPASAQEAPAGWLMRRIDAAADALSEVMAFTKLEELLATKVSRSLSGLRAVQANASPSAAVQQGEVLQPLTLQQITKIACDLFSSFGHDDLRMARAIEEAHGITSRAALASAQPKTGVA